MRKVFHLVALADDLPPGEGRLVTVGGCSDFALFRAEDGGYYAAYPLCPHQNEPLDRGHLEGCEVICRRHHLRFDLRTGDCTNAAGYSMQTYDVRVKDGQVYIGLWEE